ncbi:ABC transporter ATP-binding protein [Oscillibacter valericigenes Sjm18-20]|nr:ABC transporter ATP-binding protein [Oscillibacter valericigenes Sjm18-20]
MELREISKGYSCRQVLSLVNLRVEAGECLGITGANGSGKSTLLRMIAREQRPDSGRILLRGKDILEDRLYTRNRMGYVPQDNALAEELTIGQQLELWQAARGVQEPLQAELMELMGLEPLLRCRVRELSGGMQRRVSIAMALAAGKEVLVMDEATTGLDQAYCDALLEWLAIFLRRGGCILWCSHRRDELDRLCNRCLCLRDGQAYWGL